MGVLVHKGRRAGLSTLAKVEGAAADMRLPAPKRWKRRHRKMAGGYLRRRRRVLIVRAWSASLFLEVKRPCSFELAVRDGWIILTTPPDSFLSAEPRP